MSDLKLPGENTRKKVTFGRVAIWVVVAGIGVYLLVTGIIGIIVKG